MRGGTAPSGNCPSGKRTPGLGFGLALRLALGLVLALALACTSATPTPSRELETAAAAMPLPAGGGPWNVLLIETDDQRWDTLWAMPRVQELLARDGAVFTNAMVSNPACCPSRTSLLSGGFYSHHTGVLQPGGLNGGQRFNDADTLATRLQSAGYRTGLVGKYLLHFRPADRRIPPGWSHFFIETTHRSYYHHRFLDGASEPDRAGLGEHRRYRRYYITDLEKEVALEFLEASLTGDEHRPFFLWLATHAPHRPADPAPEDRTAFPDFKLGGRAYGEEDLSDKPPYVQHLGRDFGDFDSLGISASLPHRQLKTLLPVDRAVEAILARLEASGELERTAIIFTSDNGFLWGEHRLFRKGMPYDESLRVPLVIRLPGIPAGERPQLVAMDLDLAPTVLALAGLEPVPGADGRSLLPELVDPRSAGRQALFSEGFRTGDSPSWCAVRTGRYKWVEHSDGVRELYDLHQDPYELESRHQNPDLEPVRRRLAQRLNGFRGLAAVTRELPPAVVGTSYEARLEATGGTPPYSWTVVDGHLPPGLRLTPEGILSGIPTGAAPRAGKTSPPQSRRQRNSSGTAGGELETDGARRTRGAARPESFVLEVQDRSRSPRDGRPQSFRMPYSIAVSAPPPTR